MLLELQNIDMTISHYLHSTVNLPVIIKNPKNTLVNLNSDFTNVTFTCEADGASSYYWERQHGRIPSGATGVDTNNLIISNLQLKDAGYYRCIAVNGSGSTKSEYAKLTLAGMHVCIYKTIVSVSSNIKIQEHLNSMSSGPVKQ